MTRTDGLDDVLRPWMARNAPPPPGRLLLRVMEEVDTMQQHTTRRSGWLLSTQPLAAVMVTAAIAILAVIAGYTVLNLTNTGSPPVGGPTQAEVRVNVLLDTLHNGTAEEYAQLYAPVTYIYGNAGDDPAGSPGIGRSAVIAGFENFHNTATHLERVGEVVESGQFVTFHFRWTNGLGMEGNGVTTLLFNDQGLVQYDATFLALDE